MAKPIFQSHLKPTEILLALTTLATPATTRLRIAVAYTSIRGCRTLMPALSAKVGGACWQSIPKVIITSFEFGHTEPEALLYLGALPNCSVRIASVGASAKISILPPVTNFHPKLYLFDRGLERDALIASANLSQRAMTVNTEMGIFDQASSDGALLDEFWDSLLAESVALTDAILDDYRIRRKKAKQRPAEPDRALRPIAIPPLTALQPFGDAVAAGRLDPSRFSSLWIQAGAMSSGGSHNQLELPRAANRFFGFQFGNYSAAHQEIGRPVLFTNANNWTDRLLTWHGNNRMERINLPTLHQGGFAYSGTAVLFRREGGGFRIEVAPWTSAQAIAWRNASAQLRTVFRLGTNTNRICGLF